MDMHRAESDCAELVTQREKVKYVCTYLNNNNE